jgi:MFS family permease
VSFLSFFRGNILVLTICNILWRLSQDVIWPFIGLYILALGGEYETVGLVMAIGNLASALLYPLGGYIADKQGRIKVMGYMTYAYAFTFLIFVFTDGWRWVAIGMFAQSLVTFYLPAMQALMADSLPVGKRGLGFAATFAIPSAFGIASPVIGGWLIDRLGVIPAIKNLYLYSFFIALIVATLRLKFLKETIKPSQELKITTRGIPRLLIDAYRDVFQVVKQAPKQLILLSALTTSAIFFVSLVTPFWIIRAKEVIGLSTQEWGLIAMISGVIYVILSIPAGRVVDKVNRKTVVGLCLIAGAAPVTIFLYVTDFTGVALLAVITAVINSFINPAMQALFTDMVPKNTRGRMIAALGGGGVWLMGGAWGLGVVAMLSITFGSLLSGYIYRLEPSLPWLIMAAGLVVTGVLFLVLLREPDAPED